MPPKHSDLTAPTSLSVLLAVFLVFSICGCVAKPVITPQTTTTISEPPTTVVVTDYDTSTTQEITLTTQKIQTTTSQKTPEVPTTTLLQPSFKTFEDLGGSICALDGKPIIRMYSKDTCDHCKWSKPLFKEVMAEYGGAVVAHIWEFGSEDDMMTADVEGLIPSGEQDVFFSSKASGTVPYFVFGCRFVRVGNGYYIQGRADLEKEEMRQIVNYLLSQD